MKFPNLNAEMARKNLKPADLAPAMGVCTKTAYNKLAGVTPITLMETIKVRDKHFPGMIIDVLFLPERKGA